MAGEIVAPAWELQFHVLIVAILILLELDERKKGGPEGGGKSGSAADGSMEFVLHPIRQRIY